MGFKFFLLALLMLFFTIQGAVAVQDVEVVVVFDDDEVDRSLFSFFVKSEDVVVSVKDVLEDDYEFSSFEAVSGFVSEGEVDSIRSLSGVKDVLVNYEVGVALQDSVPLVGGDVVVGDFNLSGVNQSVCVIDTGVDFESHGFINDSFVGGYRFLGSDVQDCSVNRSACLDDNGHGTHVAGSILGVSPGVNLVVVKILDGNGDGGSVDLLKGVDFCVDKAEEFNISVISLSLGSSCGDELGAASLCYSSFCDASHSDFVASFDAANDKNVSVVVATGNDGKVDQISFPSCIESAVRVGSSSKDDVMSGFTNRGDFDILLAPGELINSTSLGGGFELRSGTSMATPHVSGGVVLLNEWFDFDNVSLLRRALFHSNVSVSDGSSGYSFDRLDLVTAVGFDENMTYEDEEEVVVEPVRRSGGGSVSGWPEPEEEEDDDGVVDRSGEDFNVETMDDDSVVVPVRRVATSWLDRVKSWFEDVFLLDAGWF